RGHVSKVITARRLLIGERSEPFARHEWGQVCLLLGIAARQQDGGRGQQHAPDDGLGEEAAPDFLHDDREIRPAEPRATILLGDDDAEPAELGHRRPKLAREPDRIFTQLAYAAERRASRHQLARRAREDLLLFGTNEAHAVSPAGRALAWR